MRKSLAILSTSILLSLCVFLTMATLWSSGVSAASAKPSAKKCVVTLVKLHGNNKADISCLSWSSSGISPNTQRVDCSNTGARLEIDSNTNGSVCFEGSGYLAFRLDYVYNLSADINGGDSGWVRYYPEGSTNGNFFYFNKGDICQQSTPSLCSAQNFVSLMPNLGITQVYLD